MNTIMSATELGRTVGLAMARTAISEGVDLEWTGLEPADGDVLTDAGIMPGTPEWEAAEEAAAEAFGEAVEAVPHYEAETCLTGGGRCGHWHRTREDAEGCLPEAPASPSGSLTRTFSLAKVLPMNAAARRRDERLTYGE